jgi:hypothetical protein
MTSEDERDALATAVRWSLGQQASLEPRLAALEDAVGSVMCRIQNSEMLPLAVANWAMAVRAAERCVRSWDAKTKRGRKANRRERTSKRCSDCGEAADLVRGEAAQAGEERKLCSHRKGTLNDSRLEWFMQCFQWFLIVSPP